MSPSNPAEANMRESKLADPLRRVLHRYHYAIATILLLIGITLRLLHSAFHEEGLFWEILGDMGTFLALVVSIHFVYELWIKREEQELFIADLEALLERQQEKTIESLNQVQESLKLLSRPAINLLDSWDTNQVCEAIAAADANTTISILQTSIPDATRLISYLENLLINEDKQFKLRLLLINFNSAEELIAARMKLRLEKPANHIMEVQANIEQMIDMKKQVDTSWAATRNGATLELEIRLYDFLPFGSHYQVGKDVIFVGLFWNTTSSINGPMIKVTKSERKLWKVFEKQFTAGWEHAEQAYPTVEMQAKH